MFSDLSHACCVPLPADPFLFLLLLGSWVSAVSIATGYGLDDRGAGVQGARVFSSPCCPDWFGAHPASYAMGTGGSFPGGKAGGAVMGGMNKCVN
jgi:hypothetical protein